MLLANLLSNKRFAGEEGFILLCKKARSYPFKDTGAAAVTHFPYPQEREGGWVYSAISTLRITHRFSKTKQWNWKIRIHTCADLHTCNIKSVERERRQQDMVGSAARPSSQSHSRPTSAIWLSKKFFLHFRQKKCYIRSKTFRNTQHLNLNTWKPGQHITAIQLTGTCSHFFLEKVLLILYQLTKSLFAFCGNTM